MAARAPAQPAANLWRGTHVDLDAELRGYVDLVTDEKIARGIPAPEARRQARLEVAASNR